MEIRRVAPAEYQELGEITLRAYKALVHDRPLGPYEAELLDVARRDEDSEVLVAVDEAGTLLGGVTYVPSSDRHMSEFSDPEAAGIRMLAVDPARQGAGAGKRLALACVERAERDRRKRIILHSTPLMTVAHDIYLKLGFKRSPALDVWANELPDTDEPLHLMAFTLELSPR